MWVVGHVRVVGATRDAEPEAGAPRPGQHHGHVGVPILALRALRATTLDPIYLQLSDS